MMSTLYDLLCDLLVEESKLGNELRMDGRQHV